MEATYPRDARTLKLRASSVTAVAVAPHFRKAPPHAANVFMDFPHQGSAVVIRPQA